MSDAPLTEHESLTGDPESSNNHYAHLVERADGYIRERGGAVPEDDVIGHVFGTIGTPDLWRSLLRSLLGASGQLTLRADGCWTIPGLELTSPSTLLGEFVAIDVETTGLRPLHHRIIEVALIRFRDGQPIERWESFCDPRRRIPAYITKLTGIADVHVADAPSFEAVADQIASFVGDSLLIGHNIVFDISFLNAEFKRFDLPTVLNDTLDTLRLATSLLPALRKPSLDKVAQELNLQPRGQHRAGQDAELTGHAAVRLAEIARMQGIDSIERLKGLGARAKRRPRDAVGRGRAVLDRSLLVDVPKAPGVYIMRDGFGHVIYVGKAKNLRDRVASYYSQPLGYTRKLDGLLENLDRIDVIVVGGELEALLLEAQLIRRYQPRYNTALRSFEHYPYIRVDISNPWPRVTLAKARKDDGARYFGPFRHTSAARKTIDLINQVVPLRTCPRSFKDARSYGSPCLRLDLGRCLGPCVGKADRESYAGLVRDVVSFLDGRDEVLYERLWSGLEDAAARLDFESAARLRNDLRSVNAIVGTQRLLRESVETHTLVLVLPSPERGSRELMLVVAGRIWAQFHVDQSDPEDLADRLARSWRRFPSGGPTAIEHDQVDEANILNRWLFRNAGHPAIVPLPRPPSLPDWREIAVQVLCLSEEDIKRNEVDPANDDDPLAPQSGADATRLTQGNDDGKVDKLTDVVMTVGEVTGLATVAE